MNPTLFYASVEFQNFGPYAGKHVFQLDRGPGVWHIDGRNPKHKQLGANGVGKSTLQNIIYWCCTGRTMRNTRPGDRIETRHVKGTTYVKLFIRKSGVEHILYRSRKPSALTLDDKVVTDEEVTAFLGIEPEVIQYTYLLGQFNEGFLSLKAEPQAAMFNDVMQLDVYLDAAERARKDASDADKLIDKLKNFLDMAGDQIRDLRVVIKEVASQEQKFEDDTKAEIETLDLQLKRITADIKKNQQAKDKLSYDIPLTEQPEYIKQSEVIKKRNEWQDMLSDYKSELSNARYSLNLAENHIAEAKAGKVCPTCKQPLKNINHQELIAEETAKAGKLRARVSKLTRAVSDASTVIEEYKAEEETLGDRLQKKLSANVENNKKHGKINEALATLREAARQAKQRQEYLSRTPNPHTRRLQQDRKRLAELKQEAINNTELLEGAEIMKRRGDLWNGYYKEIRLSIIEQTLDETAATSVKHAERLGLWGWGIQFATERETARGTTTLGWTTTLYPPDDDTPQPWDTHCGGESARWQHAVAFGLSEVLLARAGVVPNIEMLDEPTVGLSAEGITDLIDCLHQRAKETCKTIYLIDHHAMDKGSFDGNIIIEQTKEGSRILDG